MPLPQAKYCSYVLVYHSLPTSKVHVGLLRSLNFEISVGSAQVQQQRYVECSNDPGRRPTCTSQGETKLAAQSAVLLATFDAALVIDFRPNLGLDLTWKLH